MKIYNSDCFDIMPGIPDKSIDMILCDLPYGTTACKWDVVLPFDKLWEQYNRIIKDRGCIALFGSEPFSSYLRMSNIKNYKYDWIWEKNLSSNFMSARYVPLKEHENIIIFYNKKVFYNPQKIEKSESGKSRAKYIDKPSKLKEDNIYGDFGFTDKQKEHFRSPFLRYPRSVLKYNCERGLHSTQKPVKLLEYLIKTYTLENETVLDNCMGSGSTGIACMNTNREFIGIEKDDKYFDIAKKRIKEQKQLTLFKEVV